MNPKELVRDFFAGYPSVKLASQQVLMRSDEQPKGVYYIVSGRIRQYDIVPSDGSEMTLNYYENPSFIPMIWALAGISNDSYYEAVTDTVCRIAPAADVVRFLDENPVVMRDLLIRVQRGTEGIVQRMRQMMGGDARSRTAYELGMLCRRFGRRQGEGYVLDMGVGEVAISCGLARETFSRQLAEFKEAGWLTVGRGRIEIYDMKHIDLAARGK